MKASFRKFFKCAALVLISACILLFTGNNYAAVTLSLFPLPYEIEMRVFLLVLLCFSLGVLTGGVAMSLRHAKGKRRLRERTRQMEALQNELDGLKSEQASARALPALAHG